MDQLVSELSRHDEPVVTLLGSYDTGKSALLRRILIDEGVAVPEWLTISGRHETFEADEVAAAGCVLRDTPGWDIGGKGDRASAHNAASSAATDLTDAVLVVLTPQLATAELPAIQAVLARGWTEEGLAFAINRFDEAGVSPDDDPEGYRDLAARKIAELREAIPGSDDRPVFVVASDPYGLQGPAQEVDPEEWDAYRGWDGISPLQAWLRGRSVAAKGLRKRALERYWGERLEESLNHLQEAATALREVHRECEAGAKRLALFEERLDALDRSVKADLNGELMAVAKGATGQNELDEEWLRQRLLEALERWFDRSFDSLGQLNEELVTEFEVQSGRPIIRAFDLLPPSTEEGRRTIPDREFVERLGSTTLNAWRAFEEQRQAESTRIRRPARLSSSERKGGSHPQGGKGKPTPSPRPDAGSATALSSRALSMATALAPHVYELIGLLNEKEADHRRAEAAAARRQELREAVEGIIDNAARDNTAEWDRVLRSQREAARAAWGPLSEMSQSIEEQLTSVQRQLGDGLRLHSERPD